MARMAVSLTSNSKRLTAESDAYVGRLERAGEQLMRTMAEETALKAIDKAPEGQKPDKRTKKLKDSIRFESGRNYARVIVTARHALITEYGAGPSQIPGGPRTTFFWEKYNRKWVPGTNIIDHPPTHSQPYMRPALDEIMLEWHEIARQYYPQ